MRVGITCLVVLLVGCSSAVAQQPPATTQAVGKFPFLNLDARKRVVEVECEALRCGNPLEFFLCSAGTNEHEAVLRSKVKPSHLHAALLALGLKPGEPVHYSEAAKKWLPPHGPPMQLGVRFERDGKPVEVPAYRLMRDVKSKGEMQPLTWIFAGSRMLENGQYGADRTGYLVSIVNFDFTVIDIPKLASNANETLTWETNIDLMPAVGTKVMLVITPVGDVEAPATQAFHDAHDIDQPLIQIDLNGKVKLGEAEMENVDELMAQLKKRVTPQTRVRVAVANEIENNVNARHVINALSRAGIRFMTIPQATAAAVTRPSSAGEDEVISHMRSRWEDAVGPHRQAVRDAAKSHNDVIQRLRAEQQRLINEADKIQRLIDELEGRYQDMTSPQPAPGND